jgi:hypothetical protein
VRFTEIDLFGVYVAPMSLMLVAAIKKEAEERSGLDGAHLALHSFHPARNA